MELQVSSGADLRLTGFGPASEERGDVDLTGVDPTRWPEIRRRVAILDEYVRIRRPSRAVRQDFAKRIGLQDSQFMYVARAWRISRDASLIPGARSRTRRPKRRRLDDNALTVVSEVISDLGPIARRKDVLAEVASRCAREGLVKPSASTVANILASSRAVETAPVATRAEILIDECTIKLPVACGNAVAMPRLMLALILPERHIAAAELTLHEDRPPSPNAIFDTLKRMSEDDGTPLKIRAPHLSKQSRKAIGAISRDAGRGLPTLGRLLGNRIGDLVLIHQSSKARPGALLANGRHASVLGIEDATKAIENAIALHNERVPPMPVGGYRIASAHEPRN